MAVDASVAGKWFVHEPGHEAAIDVVRSSEELIAPDLVIPEVMNVLRRKQRQDLLSSRQLSEAADAVPHSFSRFVPAADLVRRATALSQSLDHSVYDCFYLACAALNGCRLLTADGVFVGKVAAQGNASLVVDLAVWTPVHRDSVRRPEASMVEAVSALYDRFMRVLDGVRDGIASPSMPSGEAAVTHSGDLAPALGSPSYVSLTRFVVSLSRSDRAELLALGWLSQARKGDDWPLVLARADAYLSDNAAADHTHLIISMLPLFEKGLERLRAQGDERSLVPAPNDKA